MPHRGGQLPTEGKAQHKSKAMMSGEDVVSFKGKRHPEGGEAFSF